MNFSFDYFRNFKKPDIILCNPDRRQIALIETREANLTLRFNDLSELTFEVPLYATDAKGNRIEYDYYSRVETQRLILIDGIGYFKMVQATEVEDGLDKYKSVTARSLQIRLNDFGFFMENRLYSFFNPGDPFDDSYDGSLEQIPSVVGQLNKQLKIQIDPRVIQGLSEIEQDYEDWTISYINPSLRYFPSKDDNILRSFTESNTLWGLDFIINNAAELFEVIFEFDFLRQAIKIKTVAEVTERTNIYLSFDNVMNELELTEQADDIVTVLSCNGNNLNIRSVNPTGTNYIADFSYFMAEEGDTQPKWMSQALSQKIREWQAAVDAASASWEQLVLRLQDLYKIQAELNSERVYYDLKLQDMEAARDRYLLANTDDLNNLEELETAKAIFTAEAVKHGESSLDERCIFNSIKFYRDTQYTCYRTPPKFIQENRVNEHGVEYWSGRFSFSDNTDGRTATFNANYLLYSDAMAPTVTPVGGHIYFVDAINGDNLSYCKLIGEVAEINSGDPDNPILRWQVKGFERYTIFSGVREWIEIYQGVVGDFLEKIEANDAEIEAVLAQMNAISSTLNLQKFFDLSNPQESKLFRELKNYWIENEYTNDGLAVFDTTAPEEAIDLARELMEESKEHLSKINQPRFSINVDAIDFTKIEAFKTFAGDLRLGRVITIEKSNDIHYYPALTSLSLKLDDTDSFTLVFSNALKPDSQDFLYADLAKQGASMARSVTANWQEITSFSRRESAIEELLYEPLNRTLRTAQSSMSRQEFLIDETGILGRRYKEDSRSSFENEQVRIINNLILFTDDGWQTAKTALGKINLNHPIYGEMTAYGLLAEALVGSLIIGNTFYISNENNTILLDLDGITISAPGDPSDVRFHADNDGNVSIKGNIDALTGTIGGLVIENNSIYSDNGKFSVDAEGYLKAVSGKIGGWKIEINRLISSNTTTGDGYVGLRSDTDNDIYSFWAGWAPATTIKSFSAYLISTTEELEEHKTQEPTIAGTYNNEGGVILVDEANNNLATEFADTADKLRRLKVNIDTSTTEITFTLTEGTAKYKYFFVGGAIVLGDRVGANVFPIGLDVTKATITIADTLMTVRWSYQEEISWTEPVKICPKCLLPIDECICDICPDCGEDPCVCVCPDCGEDPCICVCDECGELLDECTCVCDECGELKRECFCECDVCGEYPCVCPCDICGENPCECPCSVCGENPCVCPPWICSECGKYPCECVPPTPRTISIKANYRQVYVEPEPIPQQGLLNVYISTTAALVTARDFNIEIKNLLTNTTYSRTLTVAAGGTRSTSTTVPIDLTTYNQLNWQLRFTENWSSVLNFTQNDLLGTPTSTLPNFGVMPNGYFIAVSGKIGSLNFEGERLYSSSFALETVTENGRLVSNLNFFDSLGRVSSTFSSEYLQVPSIYTEYIGGNTMVVAARDISTNTLSASGTITAGRIQGAGGAYIDVNSGASPVYISASLSASSNFASIAYKVTLSRQVLTPVTITVQYKVIGGNWHTIDYYFSGSTTSISKDSVTCLIGCQNASIISNAGFYQTPSGSGVRIEGNLNWNGRMLYINGSDNTIRAY